MILNGISTDDKAIHVDREQKITLVRENRSITVGFSDLFDALDESEVHKTYMDFTIHS